MTNDSRKSHNDLLCHSPVVEHVCRIKSLHLRVNFYSLFLKNMCPLHTIYTFVWSYRYSITLKYSVLNQQHYRGSCPNEKWKFPPALAWPGDLHIWNLICQRAATNTGASSAEEFAAQGWVLKCKLARQEILENWRTGKSCETVTTSISFPNCFVKTGGSI